MDSEMNICLRFCLGNTDLSLAKGLYQIMEDHAVVAWTDLHIVGLYGRPADLVEATIKSFYLHPSPSSSSSPFSASSSSPLHHPSPLTATTTDSLAAAAAAATPPPPPAAHSTSIEITSLEDLEVKVTKAQSAQGDGRNVKGKGKGKGKETLSCSSPSSTTLSQDTTNTEGDDDGDNYGKKPSREILPRYKWKTDYDLWAEKHPPSDSEENFRSRNEPPFQILIALPENIRLYLLTVSGAFTSYLLEERTVGACYAQGGIMEDLLEAREEADMMVSDSREYNMTVVETRDLEALRRVLWGVTTALATEPVREYTERWMKELYAEKLEEWDQTLKLYRETHEDLALHWVTEDQEQEGAGETWIGDDQDKQKSEGRNENTFQVPWTWTEYEGLDRFTGKAKNLQR